ncbi:MAG: heme-binding protein [Acidobacteria bacterium]|nr:heme-binding protein [Acidobacteriota bacterium]
MRRINRDVFVLSVALCCGLMATVAGAQAPAVTGPSLAQAQAALAATEQAANEMGVGLSCAVVDSRGTLVALARMDSASYFTADVAAGKARASAAFRAPSGALARVGELGLADVVEGGPMLFVQGAVPIMKDGQSMGAIGCSGATGQQDEDAANAGIAAMQ